ncbi:NYN domain-containing protein [Deminuibacter soli]|uniref:NYN domain-containing protein n=1 Tax=Deminuibacter soli TaxID=2291815 RepID=A0A3E1NNW7_9BACT|nr:NYN domain-containing protein [Deminuibacter soli]RFM29631.1 NYN domain-containing protein [Deminuibacter soli]
MTHNHSTAILIDGAFFLKQYAKVYYNGWQHSPGQVAKNLYTIAHRHIGANEHLYRIFYYDSEPLLKKAHNPVTKKAVDFSKTPQASYRLQLFEELKKKRKVALRLGAIKDTSNWVIKPDITKQLLNGTLKIEDLKDTDVVYEMRQKGIDMKIGVDIASLSLKRFVRQIVLISGDSDFVPASKLARREGVDFILDPMWNHIDKHLFEHIDGLRSTCPNPNKYKPGNVQQQAQKR